MMVLHLGLAKTGTSWLQQQVFPQMDIYYYNPGHYEVLTIPTHTDKPTVISFEGLSGTTYNNDRYILLYRLHKLFPNAKILVTTRNKIRYIRSLYSQYIRGGGTQSLQWWSNYLFSHPYFMDWKLYFNQIQKLWGTNNLLLLPLELLKQNYKQYLQQLCYYVGVPIPSNIDRTPRNTGLDDKQCTRWKTINQLYVSRWNDSGLLPKHLNPCWIYQKVIQYTKP